jgi:hypothetical protein
MNDDLESKLHALTGALRRPDPTPAWKTDILARARREATVIPLKQTLPPRWLMLGWAAAWMAILALNFTAPRDAELSSTTSTRKQSSSSSSQGDVAVLFAFQQHQMRNLNLDLP